MRPTEEMLRESMALLGGELRRRGVPTTKDEGRTCGAQEQAELILMRVRALVNGWPDSW